MSSPPPNGSASTSVVRWPARAAVTASAQARVEAPAPPRPPSTATVRAGGPTPSAASAIRSSSQLSASGRNSTCSAPSWTARTQISESSRSSPSRSTPGLRGRPVQCSARSSPTSTSGVLSHSWRGGGAAQSSIGSAPAAAQRRSRCSASASSSVMISGRAGAGPSAGSWSVMGVDMAVSPGGASAPHAGGTDAQSKSCRSASAGVLRMGVVRASAGHHGGGRCGIRHPRSECLWITRGCG